MKKLYFLGVFLLPHVIIAQKSVDLDRYSFSVQFRSLPKKPVDSSYRTYHVEVEGTRLMEPFLRDLTPERSVLLDGWRKLPQNGHLAINVKLGDLIPESVSLKQRTEPIKNRSGQVTGTRTYYHQEVTYSFEATATIHDFKGVHIMDQELADRQYKRVYKSPEFTVRALADGYFVLNSMSITSKLYEDCVNRATRYLSERITEDFGFSEVTVKDNMWIIDSRKHPEYSNHRRAFQQLTEVLFSMNASTPIDNAKVQLEPVIEYFEKIKKIYTSTSKHDRKIRYASYFNLAVLYYYLDDPQAMMKEARGLALNDFDARDAKGFENTATWLKNLFLETNIHTRHFHIDTSIFKGPYEQDDVTVK